MIPRVIHYCWFGGSELPELENRCVASWGSVHPHWDIKRWDESNFDVFQCAFSKSAYENKKWAFVSDYARFKILFEFGGVFLDTDVELLRPLDDLLSMTAFTGFTKSAYFVAPGLIVASEAKGKIVEEVAKEYEAMRFESQRGRIHPQSSPRVLTRILVDRHGLKRNGEYQNLDDITICPAEWFDPLDPHTGEMVVTSKTYSIHHYSGTWLNPAKKYRIEMRKQLATKVGPRFSWLISSIASIIRYGRAAF